MFQSKTLSYFILFLVAAVFVTVFSVSTSFLYPYPDTLDSHVFQLIGKYWSKGSIPYVDLWDQKGPVIYFINAIGYWLTDSKLGVFILQILFLYADLIILYRIFHLRCSSSKLILYIVIFLFALAQLYGGGNNIEEYILPFLLLGFYLQYRYIKSFSDDNDVIHPLIWAAFYGFILAFALLTRLTNALGICAGAAFIGLLLIKKNEWKNLLCNIFAFILGFALLFLPFAFYFYAHDAFDEMWYAMITYNMEYAANASNIITTKSFLLNFINPLCSYLCLIISFFLLYHKHYIIGLYGITIVMFPLLWILTSNGYAHYSMLCLPYLTIALLQLDDCRVINIISKKKFQSLQTYFSVAIIICCLFVNVRSITRGYFYSSSESKQHFYKSILSHIQDQGHDSFISFNITPSIYLYSGIKPASRFFCNQNFYCYNSKSMTKLMNIEYESCKAKWLLVKQDNMEMIKNIISKNYKDVHRKSYDGKDYVLFKRVNL